MALPENRALDHHLRTQVAGAAGVIWGLTLANFLVWMSQTFGSFG